VYKPIRFGLFFSSFFSFFFFFFFSPYWKFQKILRLLLLVDAKKMQHVCNFASTNAGSAAPLMQFPPTYNRADSLSELSVIALEAFTVETPRRACCCSSSPFPLPSPDAIIFPGRISYFPLPRYAHGPVFWILNDS
jgi:hypothetical protein